MCICIDSLIDSASHAGQRVRGPGNKKPAKDAILEKTWDMQWKVDRRCSGMGRLRSVTVANTRILRDCGIAVRDRASITFSKSGRWVVKGVSYTAAVFGQLHRSGKLCVLRGFREILHVCLLLH
jgi:hypothetical protein